jgi:MoaA/NifB/PqqE/SkfB family radical SAM enzyme
MIKTTAINEKVQSSMMITWDTGRRCNYDCTYCDATRHTNYSKHSSLNDLLKTFYFAKEWYETYTAHRVNPVYDPGIDFTGGEPTNNPNFWNLIKEIKNIDDRWRLSLTTNGTWHYKRMNTVLDTLFGLSISYHPEADKKLKDRVLKNIVEISQTNLWLQVNVMLHVDYWDEVVQVCDFLDSKGIKYNPVPIGDGNRAISGWFIDADGNNRRTSHVYSKEQQEWFWKKTNFKGSASDSNEGTNIGRKCCGGRCLVGKVDNEWQDIKLIDNHFKGWSCTVDWYFLHINQEFGDVYHHQTCRALHGEKIGAIGNLKDSEKLIADLKERLKNPTPIICPNQRCGCGMCTPKAKDQEDFKVIWASLVK